MGIISKRLNTLKNEEVNGNGTIFDNQVECAKEILQRFDGTKERDNYVVVKGQCQAGKTGVLYALMNIINKFKLKQALGINLVLYCTGDNSKDLIIQQENRKEKQVMVFKKGEDIGIDFRKRSGLKDFKEKVQSTNGTLIFIDESDYGTEFMHNKLPEFLKYYGIEYLKNGNELEENNIYIISTTATPYKEIESDRPGEKNYVFLKPGDGYIGVQDFDANGNVTTLSKNAFAASEVDSVLPNLVNEWYEHLKDIEDRTGKVKCAIVRVGGRNDLKHLKKYAGGMFDIQQFDTERKPALDYRSLWNMIDTYCGESTDRTPGKYLMVVVKDALRRGISIREADNKNRTKNRIAVLYDYPSDKNKPETAEQGLLGRMCGYRAQNDEEWKDIRFYLPDCLWDSIHKYYNGEPLVDDNGRPKRFVNSQRRKEKVEITLDEAKNLELGKDYYLGIKNDDSYESYFRYDITDFINKKNYKVEVLKDNEGRGRFRYKDNILYPYMFEEKNDPRFGNGTFLSAQAVRTFNGNLVGRKGNYDKTFVEAMLNENAPLTMTGRETYAWTKKPESIGSIAYGWLLEIEQPTEDAEPRYYIRIKLGTVYPYKLVETYVDGNGVKTAETMLVEA